MEQVRRREDIPMTAGADRTRGALGGTLLKLVHCSLHFWHQHEASPGLGRSRRPSPPLFIESIASIHRTPRTGQDLNLRDYVFLCSAGSVGSS